MVLSREEFAACESDRNEKMKSLFQLRQSTNSFLVQCLADREIQKIQHNQDKAASKAYRYNCAVVHSPHSFSQFSAGQGHGWDSFHERTIDPKLRLGKVFHASPNRILHDVSNNINHGNNMQATIDILREENANLKSIYTEQLRKYEELQRSRPSQSVSSDRRFRDIEAENALLVQQVQSKDTQITNLSAQVNSMRSQITRLATSRQSNSEVTVNETLISELLSQNEAYKCQIAFKDAEIRNLDAQVRNLRSQYQRSQRSGRGDMRENNDCVGCCVIS